MAQVRRVHRRVNGIAPDGRPYSAADPELVTFIHAAEVSSFLESSQRFGSATSTPEQCDRYYEEVAPVALALGADLGAPLGRRRGELLPAAPARALRQPPGPPGPGLAARGVARRPERAGRLLASCVAAAISILPGWARRELGLSVAGPLDLLVRHGGRDSRSRAGRPPRCAGS